MHQGSVNNHIKTESYQPIPHLSNVIAATPAKKITFFKSGDPQFSGVRMAIHKRSFKCFDALLDDLSQKVPLPFGVRAITTPKGTHFIQHLDQLKDKGCYLCSDRQYAKPINMEAAGQQPVVWNYRNPHNTRKKPSRPEEPLIRQSGQHYNRHLKRMILVKNSDPAVRRSIILSKRMARSLRVFMDEISELMQCHVRKLYTLEGRKIDSIQSLLQSPSVLVCVGREAFKPLLLENLWKHSDEKLPGLCTGSHTSTGSDGHESKKNVNFGLVTKKSIIHPRSDSSNKSARFSLSSEKSYPNGSGITTRQLSGIQKEVIMNDDIEKRVFVNKDGSLSVEMKVRFRLVDDETLQWSTEIKKLPSNTNAIHFLKNTDSQYLPDKVEYSDSEYNPACEAEEAHGMTVQMEHCNELYCQNCSSHDQGYDIWKNPAHEHDGFKSVCSSGSSHKIQHHKTSVDSVCISSGSSEEYTEHVVEKTSCFEKTVKEGKTEIKYCSVSRCCSRNEVTATSSVLNCNLPTDSSYESNAANICQCQIRTANFAEFNKKCQDCFKSNRTYSNPEQDTQCIGCCSYPPENINFSPVLICSAHTSKPAKNRCIQRISDISQQKMYTNVNGTDSDRFFEPSRSYSFQCNCKGETAILVTPNRLGGLKENTNIAMKSKSKENAISTAIIDGNNAQETTESEYANGCANTSISEKCSKSIVCTCSGGKKSTHSENVQVADEDVKVKSCKCIKHFNNKPFHNHTPQREGIHNSCTSAVSDLSDVSATSKQSKTPNDKSLLGDFTYGKKKPTSIMSVQLNESEINGNTQVRATNVELEKQNENNSDIIVQDLNKPHQNQEHRSMSGKAHTFKDFQKSYKLTNNIQEPANISSTSKISEKSNVCSVKETRQKTDQSAQFLPVSSPSTKKKSRISTPNKSKSFISIGATNRAQSTITVNSKQSSTSGQSGICHCSQSNDIKQEKNDKSGHIVTSSPLNLSLTPSSLAQSNEHLSPPSTVSVPFGFPEEENEGSMSSRSEILNKNKCSCKKSETEPPPDSSLIVKNEHKSNKATSTSSTISLISKLSYLEDQSEKEQYEQANSSIFLAESQSSISTPTKQERIAENISNKQDQKVPFCLSENLCPKPPCDGSQLKEINLETKECTGSQSVDETLFKSLSVSSLIEVGSEKTTSKDAAQRTTKSKKRSKESNKAVCCSDSGSFTADKKTCQHKKHNSVDEATDTNVPNTTDQHLSGLEVPNKKPVKGRRESEGSRSNSSCPTKKHKKPSTTPGSKIINEIQGQDQLMPSSLPSASPTEIINNWLKNIPNNGLKYELEEELIYKHDEAVHQIPAVEEEGQLQNEIEGSEKQKNVQLTLYQNKSIICGKANVDNETQVTKACCDPILTPKLCNNEGLTNHCQSTIHVMKRCNSLPEVSSAYEKKVSTSINGLLDCLASLPPIDSNFRNKGERYNEILGILQSLWLCEHSKTESDKSKLNDQYMAVEECNLKSSLGGGLNLVLIGSAKGNIDGGNIQLEETKSTVALTSEQKVEMENQEENKYDSLCAITKNINISDVSCDPLTPDIADRVRCSPEDNTLDKDSQKNGTKSTEITELFFNMTSDTSSNAVKSSTNKKHSPEDTKSGTSSSGQTGEITKRVSQDPDPVWVLGLLKKIEQQFMSHYANAVEEFKVKWNLNNSETLDAMIYELKEEVHKRIQSTINRELQKIQGRVGRTPRRPLSTLSKDSSIQTEQRRERLKVMKNKLVNLSLSRSEDLNTGSGTELSDQRSDDEYCPCDTCMKKKMACKVIQRGEALSLAPVHMDFDLKRILQKKKDPLEPTPMQVRYFNAQDEKNLEVVPEEDEVPHTSHKDKNQMDAVAPVIHIKYKNVPVDLGLAPEDQDTEVVVASNEAEAVQKVLFDDSNKSQKALEEGLNKKKETVRKKTEIERVKCANNSDEEEKNKKAAWTFNEMSEKKAALIQNKPQEETGIDLGPTKNDTSDEAEKIERTENCEIEEEHYVKKGDINLQLEDEIIQKEENEWEESEQKVVIIEDMITVEDRESVQVCKTSDEILGLAIYGNMRANTETQYECEKINKNNSLCKDSETCNDSQDESVVKRGSDESTKLKEFIHEDEEGLITFVQVDKGGEYKQRTEFGDGETNKISLNINKVNERGVNNKNVSDQNQDTAHYLRSDSINPGEIGQTCGEAPEPRLFQQMTKTSVESQPGSFEGYGDLKKLNEFDSLIEISER